MPIKLINTTLILSKKIVLNHLDLSLKEKGITFLLGKNGAGKTQFLRLIHGLSKPNTGSVYIPNNKKQAFIFQQPVLLNRSVFENLLFVTRQQKIDKKLASQKINHSLTLFELSKLSQQNANTLSGGQKKRLAIARAYLLGADIYLFDEPSANIDIRANLKIESIICDFISQNKKVVLSTHDPEQIKRLIHPDRDEVIILKDGVVAYHKNSIDTEQILHLL